MRKKLSPPPLKWWQRCLDSLNEVLGYIVVFTAGMGVMFVLMLFAHWRRLI